MDRLDLFRQWWPVLLSIATLIFGAYYRLIVDHLKINKLESDINSVNNSTMILEKTLDEMNKTLQDISIKVALLLEGRLKIDD